MDKAITFEERHQELRISILKEISNLVQAHKAIEMAVEFSEPIFYGQGIDEQDNAPEIEEITDSGLAIIFHQGNEIERVNLEHLGTDKLIEIVGGLEESLMDAKKFSSK